MSYEMETRREETPAELREEIIRLRAEVAAWKGRHEGAVAAMAADVTRLRAEVERLRAALEPFANAAVRYDPDEGDDGHDAWDWTPTIGMLRRARAALAQGGDNG